MNGARLVSGGAEVETRYQSVIIFLLCNADISDKI
jgi:hypothetical protein